VPHAVTDRLIDEPGTAEVLGVSRRSVRRLAQQEILDRVKVGSATRYRLSQIERIIAEGTRPVRKGPRR
jgi:predicted DNA-binding transcriptional regulator AlpA